MFESFAGLLLLPGSFRQTVGKNCEILDAAVASSEDSHLFAYKSAGTIISDKYVESQQCVAASKTQGLSEFCHLDECTMFARVVIKVNFIS